MLPARSLPAVSATLLLAAFCFAGCTSASQDSAGDFEDEERAVAQVVEDLQKAGQDGDARRICQDILAQPLRAQASDCAKRIDTALDDVSNYELQVDDVTVQGTTATARVEVVEQGETHKETLRLVKESGVWRLASLG